MTDDNLFQKTNKDGNEGKTYLDQLVGEGRKYSDPEQLAKGYANYDELNKDLTRQLDELRQELSKQDHAKELLEKIKGTQGNDDRQKTADPTGSKDEDGGQKLGTEEMIRKLLSEEREKTKREENLAQISERMKKAWGDKASEEFENRLKAAGVDKETAASLAAKSPAAFYKLVGIDSTATKSTATPPETEKNADFTFNGVAAGERNWAYYEELRRKDKKKYFSVDVQRQMFKDKRELGDRFGMPT